MHYEINVTLNGAHFFATHARSLSNEEQATRALKVFRDKFPDAEGYCVTVSLCQVTGRNVTESLAAKLKMKTLKAAL